MDGNRPVAMVTDRDLVAHVVAQGLDPNQVTLEDVQRVAKRLLDPAALLTVVVGQPEGIEPTKTKGDIPS